MGSRGGRADAALTVATLMFYGDRCHLCGKSGARTKDHLVPFSHGGSDDLSNLRPAHKSCNSRRGNRVLHGYGANVWIVTGPPASGKTSYVTEHAAPGDIVIDLDAIAKAFEGVATPGTHHYPQHVRNVAIGARREAIYRATRTATRCNVWLIHMHPSPKDLDDYAFMRWPLITVNPGRPIVLERVQAERPRHMWPLVDRWYRVFAPDGLADVPADARLELADW